MLVATFIRYFKVYRGINFIPVTFSDRFSAYIGENGVGKSSVLEALDCYFNGGDWNINIESKEKGYKERDPYISPLFMMEKSKVKPGNKAVKENIIQLSEILWQVDESDFNQSQIKIARQFIYLRDKLKKSYNPEYYVLIMAGKDYQNTPQISIFGTIEKIKSLYDDEIEFTKSIEQINTYIEKVYSYIYIPAEVNASSYTKLENKSIQELMGQSIDEAISAVISNDQIRDINIGLNAYVESVGNKLNGYKYKKPARRQKNLTREEINSKVIEAFFSIRVLNKISGSNEIPVYQLSSGEKRKALLDVAYSFLCSEEKKKKEIILAIDEPEASLHTSACFD